MVSAFITSGSDEDSEGEQPLHSEHGFALLACGLSPSAMQQILGWIERLGPHRKRHFAGSHMKFIPTMDATISLPDVFLLAFNAGDAAAEKEARGYWARAKHDVPRAGFAVALGKAGLDAVEPFQPELPVIKMSETVPSKQARQLAMAFMGFAGQGLIGIDASDWLAQFGNAKAISAIEWSGERDQSPAAAAEMARATLTSVIPRGIAVVARSSAYWHLADAAELLLCNGGIFSCLIDDSEDFAPGVLVFYRENDVC